MVIAVQVVVAVALLVAWLWVLSRPAPAGDRASFDDAGRSYLDPQEEVDDDGPSLADVLSVWRRRPLACRRRQLLLATMFASFGAFFLAIALRGRFLYLFLLMIAVLGVHLAVASRIGAQMVAAERAERIVAIERRRRAERQLFEGPLGADPSGSMANGIPMATDITELSWTIDAHGQRRSAFDVAAELASQLGEPGHSDNLDAANKRFVDDLIEREWAEPEETTDPSSRSGHGPDGTSGSAVSPEPGWDPETESAPAPAGGETEAIFTKAPKDERPRSRRKAQPIYIHSHLDDGDGGTARARAVNDR